MSKYIDAEKLVSKIKEKISQLHEGWESGKIFHTSVTEGHLNALHEILDLIVSLQQEQQEVNLENEIKGYTEALYHETFGNGHGTLDEFDWEDIVQVIDEATRHFYNRFLDMKDYHYVPGWRQNKDNNKPAINHSVLMLSKYGVSEGEWDGNEWIQYRWSGKFKDSDVLYWIHLEDLQQLEKEGENIQKEDKYETALEKARKWMPKVNQGGHAILIDIFPELGEGLDPRYGGRKQEQPEVDLEKEYKEYARHFWNKGYNVKKEE